VRAVALHRPRDRRPLRSRPRWRALVCFGLRPGTQCVSGASLAAGLRTPRRRLVGFGPCGPSDRWVVRGLRQLARAFYAVAGVDGLLGIGALFILPVSEVHNSATERGFPVLRVVLIFAAIAMLSLASVLIGPAIKGGFIVAAIGAFVLMLSIDRGAAAPLLPSDAFSLRSPTGAGLWMVLLLSVAYSPLAIYAPLFLQRLHSLNPLAAGYGCWSIVGMDGCCACRRVARGGMAWAVDRGGTNRNECGTARGCRADGVGAGCCPTPANLADGHWYRCLLGLHRATRHEQRESEENVAAASVATVQQAGIAFGAAVAGLVANASGLGDGLPPGSVLRAALWVPMAFVTAPLAAGAIGVRLNMIARRSGHKQTIAANRA